MKILTTALCSVILLHRTLHQSQWFALLLLSMGVAAVQMHAQAEDHAPNASNHSDSSPILNHKPMNQALGLLSVILACLSSGFASVYFERALKSSNNLATPSIKYPPNSPLIRTSTSVWIRNIQLSFFGLLMGGVIVCIEDYREQWTARWDKSLWWWESLDPIPNSLISSDFFSGFEPIVWVVIGFQVMGGLLNALVIQHADNIAKGFATSVSILLSFAASVVLFDFKLSIGSLAGCGLVCFATWLFNLSQDRLRHLLRLKP